MQLVTFPSRVAGLAELSRYFSCSGLPSVRHPALSQLTVARVVRSYGQLSLKRRHEEPVKNLEHKYTFLLCGPIRIWWFGTFGIAYCAFVFFFFCLQWKCSLIHPCLPQVFGFTWGWLWKQKELTVGYLTGYLSLWPYSRNAKIRAEHIPRVTHYCFSIQERPDAP